MTTNLVAAIFFVIGLGLAAWLLAMVRNGPGAAVTTLEDLEGKIEVVDLMAFRNLIDPSEALLLRKRLSPETYRKIQRLRIKAAIAYVRSVYRNAGLAIRLAQQLLLSRDERVRQQAHMIQESSVRTRILAVKSLFKLSVTFAFPNTSFSLQELAVSYVRIAERIESLSILTAPLYTSRIAASFR